MTISDPRRPTGWRRSRGPIHGLNRDSPLQVPLRLRVVRRCSAADAGVLNVHQSGRKGLREQPSAIL